MSKRTAVLISLAMLAAVLAVPAHAQFTSNVEGTVTDPSGAVVAGANVTLHNTATGVNTVSTTNGSGYYRFNAVTNGPYEVIVDAPGFAKKSESRLVTTNETAGVNVTLAVAAASGSVVTVTGEAPAVNPEETRLQATLEAREIKALPLQNGSVLETLRVAPGVTGIDEDRELWAISIGGNYPTSSANGKNADSNVYMMDGGSIQSNSHNGGQNSISTVELTPNQDMVAEVAVETSTFAVDKGAGSSMKVNFTTKSGANNFHGDIGYRYSSRGFAATQDFSSKTASFKRRWLTGSLGGPIVKDKTFFFFSYLRQRQVTGLSGEVSDVTPEFTQWAAANFPNSLDVKNLLVKFPADKVTVASIQKAQDFPDLVQAGGCGFQTHGPIFGPNGAVVPMPCDLPILQLGTFDQSPEVNGYQYNIRLDQYFRQNDRLYVSWLAEPQQSDFLWWHSGYNAKTPSLAKYANVNFTHIFNPRLLNQTSVTYQRYTADFVGGTQAYETIPFLTLIFGGPFGGGQSPTGPNWFGTPGPTKDLEHNYTLRDTVQWNRGNHSLKFGFEAGHHDKLIDKSGFNARPIAMFFFDWSDFLQDAIFQYSLDTLSAQTGKYQAQIQGAQATQFGVYAQDDWKITPNLLLTLGLRWDDYGNPYRYGKNSLAFSQAFPGAGATFSEKIADSSARVVRNAYSGRANMNFLPRMGFAWSPWGNRRWSVRGGVGLYEDTIYLTDITGNLSINPPVNLNLNFSVFNPPPFNNPSTSNVFGTTPGQPPYGITYPTVTPVGFDSHGAPNGFQVGLSGNSFHLQPEKTILYNIGVERELGHNFVVGATYSGSHSSGLMYSADYNVFNGDLFDGTQDRLTPRWASINYNRNLGEANYNALILVARHTQGRFTWQSSYTYSRSMSDPVKDSSFTAPDPYTMKRYYGLSGSDVPQRFSLGTTYEFPSAGNGWLMKEVTGGWQLSGTAVAQSGTPFTIYSDAAFNGSCQPACDPTASGDFLGNGNNYAIPDVVGKVKTSGFSRSQYKSGIVTISNFATPSGYGTTPVEGNERKNMFRNPGYFSIDLALHKTFQMPWFAGEHSSLMMGIEGTNMLNRANLQGVNRNLNGATGLPSDTFGKVTSAYQARVYQLVARFEF